MGAARATIVLLAMFACAQAAGILLDQTSPVAASATRIGWLVIVAYSWLGPALFQRRLAEEMEGVSLRPEF